MLTGQHFNEILRYPVSGKDWFVKVGLQGAILIMLCPFLVGIPLLSGFIAAHTQRGITGSKDYPDWKDWGAYWTLGWKTLAASLLYYLPLVFLWGIYLVIVLIPIAIGAATNSEEVAAVGAIFGMGGLFIIYPLMFVYLIFYVGIQMAIGPKIAAGASIGEAINWKHYIWPYIKANFLHLLIIYLMSYFASLIAMVGMVALFVGLLLTMPFALALMGYAHGVAYRLSTVK